MCMPIWAFSNSILVIPGRIHYIFVNTALDKGFFFKTNINDTFLITPENIMWGLIKIASGKLVQYVSLKADKDTAKKSFR